MDTPLVLTHDHDPNVVFGPQLSPLQAPADPLSYDDLWTNFQYLYRAYHNLLFQHRDLSDARQVLQEELSALRETCWSLRSKNQELVDDAINARIQSWRHGVLVEELEKELRLLRHGELHPALTKRKITDIEDNNNDDATSDWSASTRSRSRSPLNDALTTPASGSSKLTSAPLARDEPSEDYISFGVQLIASSCEAPQESFSETRTPKRRRENKFGLDYDRSSADVDAHQHLAIVPPIRKAGRQEHTSPETSSKRTLRTRPNPPQTRSKTKSSKPRRSSLKAQNTTAAAVAAALSEAALHCDHRSSSPSPCGRPSLGI